jgi:hypothetical protein
MSSVAFSTGAQTLRVNNDVNTDLYKLQTTTTGSNVLFVNRVGNVGIGTTNPQAKLDIIGDVNMNNLYLKNTVSNYTPYPLDFYEIYNIPNATWTAYAPGATATFQAAFPDIKFIRIGKIVSMSILGTIYLRSVGTTQLISTDVIPTRFRCAVDYAGWPIRITDNGGVWGLLYYNTSSNKFEIYYNPLGQGFTGGSGTSFNICPSSISYIAS